MSEEDWPLPASDAAREDFRRLRVGRDVDIDRYIRFLSDCARLFQRPGMTPQPLRPILCSRALL